MKIDYKRVKNDFVYFATHCIVDAKTGKPFKWSSLQLKQLIEFKKSHE